MSTRINSRRSVLRDQLNQLSLELARLESRPEEPIFEDDNAVIAFKKTFGHNSTVYSYAGIRTERGVWYVTGRQQTRHCYTWDELLDFIEQNEDTMPAIWLVSAWERVQ